MCAKAQVERAWLVSVEASNVWWERKVLRNGGEKWGKKNVARASEVLCRSWMLAFS